MRAPISRSCRFESPFCLARHDNPRWLTETDRYRYHENWRAKPRSSPPPLLHFARVSTICPATNGKSVYYMMRIRLIWSFYIGVGNKKRTYRDVSTPLIIFQWSSIVTSRLIFSSEEKEEKRENRWPIYRNFGNFDEPFSSFASISRMQLDEGEEEGGERVETINREK